MFQNVRFVLIQIHIEKRYKSQVSSSFEERTRDVTSYSFHRNALNITFDIISAFSLPYHFCKEGKRDEYIRIAKYREEVHGWKVAVRREREMKMVNGRGKESERTEKKAWLLVLVDTRECT